MKRQADPDPAMQVGPLLKDLLGRRPEFSANPIGDWRELVGEQVARHTRPKSLKKKVLVVAAHDSVWKHHLEQYKDLLIDKINGKRKEKLVEEISIRVAEIPDDSPVLNPAHKNLDKLRAKKTGSRKKTRTPSRTLTPEEQKLLKTISDPDLRELGTRLLKRIPLTKEDSPENE